MVPEPSSDGSRTWDTTANLSAAHGSPSFGPSGSAEAPRRDLREKDKHSRYQSVPDTSDESLRRTEHAALRCWPLRLSCFTESSRIAAFWIGVGAARLSEERSSTAGSTALSSLTHGLHEFIDLSVDREELADTAVDWARIIRRVVSAMPFHLAAF